MNLQYLPREAFVEHARQCVRHCALLLPQVRVDVHIFEFRDKLDDVVAVGHFLSIVNQVRNLVGRLRKLNCFYNLELHGFSIKF